MQKIRKIVWDVSEKTALPTNKPTNQPTNQLSNYYQQHRFYRTWLTPVQKKKTFGITFNKAIDVDFSFQVDFADNKLMLPTTFIYRDHGHVRAFYKNFVILVIFQ